MVCSNGESPRIIHRKSIFRFYYWHTVKLDSFWSKNFTRLVSAFQKTPSKARLMWIKYRSSNIFHAIINKSTLKKTRINYSWNIICSWYGAKPSFLVFDLILYSTMNLPKNWPGVPLTNKVIMNEPPLLHFWINAWNLL